MNSKKVINEFLATGFLNLDFRDVKEAIDKLSENIEPGDIAGKYARKKLDEIEDSARTIWVLRSDKYWENYLKDETD